MNAPGPTVAVVRSGGKCAAVLERLLPLAEADDLIRPGHSVLIKPNLHAPQHWTTAGTTNPALVVALIRWARRRGAQRILVADSPFMGNAHPEDTFTETGMAAAVEDAGAEWTVLTRHPYRIFRNASPHLPREIGISQLALDADRLIDVAVMKTHMNCLVTLGMKNLKGCIRNEDKRAFHHDVDIDRAIVALNRLLVPHLTIVDGTLAMEGLGPHAGTPVAFRHMFASTHTPSVDAIAADAMGVAVHEARTLAIATEERLLDLGRVKVVGAEVACIRQRFERPDQAMLRQLPGLRLQTEGACSGCRLNLIHALLKDRNEGRDLPGRLLVVGSAPPAAADALLVGRCTRDHAHTGPHLPGCPPRIAAIRAFLASVST